MLACASCSIRALLMVAFSSGTSWSFPPASTGEGPVVAHGLRHPIKYVRLIRRRASSPQAIGADHFGNRYSVQLILAGHAFIKQKHEKTGTDTIGLDIGPSTLAIVPREASADLVTFCEELAPSAQN
jgi:hypothetical protein